MADKVGRDEKMDPFLKITLSIKPYTSNKKALISSAV